MPRFLVGSRIRERRQAAGLRQSDLARMAHISPSYLNLIEHNRRNVKFAVLERLAAALDASLEAFDERAETALAADLRDAAAGIPSEAPEIDAVEELIGRFPGWARVLAAQARQIGDQASAIAALTERYNHDPVLQEALHEMLTMITAIRSTAGILATEDDVPEEQARRFRATVHAESVKLSTSAQGLVRYFDDALRSPGVGAPAEDIVDAWLDEAGYAFPELEAPDNPSAVIAELIATSPFAGDEMTEARARQWLSLYAEDAQLLPLHPFTEAADAVDYEPGHLARQFDAPAHAVFRRLATLRRVGIDAPAHGLVIVTAAGQPIYQRKLAEFTPRFSSLCAHGPIFQAFSLPGQPLEDVILLPNGQDFMVRALAAPMGAIAFGERPAFASAMLIRTLPEAYRHQNLPFRELAPTCSSCARTVQSPALRLFPGLSEPEPAAKPQ